ncbi:hypothetical protein QNK12_12065 [Neobacillus cucumis]|nr:hypothetical protein QNK12_12065 [Neobacillus cucumis]
MEKYIDVMKRILDLTDTMEKGLIHIRNQVNEGYFEASLPLVQDVISAFASVEKGLMGVEILPPTKLGEEFQNLRDGFSVLTEAYEQGSGGKALEVLQFNVLPNTKKWKMSLEKLFELYLVS